MCWLAWISVNNKNILEGLCSPVRIRAKDSESFYYSENLSLYHAHLQISDLDKDTSQPFVKENIVVALVWEIYNKQQILDNLWICWFEDDYTELEIIFFAYKKIGEKFIEYLNGEFVIFIHDTLFWKYFLYRDAWWTKSLYYTLIENEFFFSSEIEWFPIEYLFCKETFCELSIFRFINSPWTLVQWISVVSPQSYVVFDGTSISSISYTLFPFPCVWNFFDTLENSLIRRLPKFQNKVSISLSWWYDSNIILSYLLKNYSGEVIAYSFLSTNNIEDVEIASRNAKIHGIKHIVTDVDIELKNGNIQFINKLWIDFLDIFGYIKNFLPDFYDIKVDFSWDCKEDLLHANFFNNERILYQYNRLKQIYNLNEYHIDQDFLNKGIFDYNMQVIEKTLFPNGIEKRMAFSDNSLRSYVLSWEMNREKYVAYLDDFFRKHNIQTVSNWKYWFADWNKYSWHIQRKNITLFPH
jgi:hypothetical protein